MKVRLEYSKDTWHKVQFKEAGGEKYVGNVYIVRKALRDIGWKKGDPIEIDINLVKN